jgi:hypothetical protein
LEKTKGHERGYEAEAAKNEILPGKKLAAKSDGLTDVQMMR